MEVTFVERLKRSWNAFVNKDPTNLNTNYGMGSYYRPDRSRPIRGSERTIISSIHNRIALDVAAINIFHCRLDDNDRFEKLMETRLNECLTLESNIDQTSNSFIQDVVASMLGEGVVAIVPVDTTADPNKTNSFDVETMRTGKIVDWYPRHVKVNVYNDRSGKREDILINKEAVGIIENPFYSVMNEPNSTYQRLVRKLSLLDTIDEYNSSGKLDLIIQLPYVVKSSARKDQANERRARLEQQLTSSKYGVAYIDGTEKITQLNRPVENTLMKQIEYLTNLLFSQLGLTQSILDGTANEQTMLNYYSRTIEPILTAITKEMKRKFLSKTARSQKQSIEYFRDPFKLVPVNNLAEIADKFTRNEIMTSNEIRQVVGMKPSNDPKADQLVNSNIAQPNDGANPMPGEDTNANPEKETSTENMDVQKVFDTLTEEQKQAVYTIIDQVTEDDEE